MVVQQSLHQKNNGAQLKPKESKGAGQQGIGLPAVPILFQQPAEPLKNAADEGLTQKMPLQFKKGVMQNKILHDDEELLQKKPFQLKTNNLQNETADKDEPFQMKKPFQMKGMAGDELPQKKPFQLKSHPQQQRPAQPNTPPNQTGLPDNLKTGVENLSGFLLDDVKVHYNSAQPAQLNALAYAQGTDIHVAPGQEAHLPHEAWHVVQQK